MAALSHVSGAGARRAHLRPRASRRPAVVPRAFFNDLLKKLSRPAEPAKPRVSPVQPLVDLCLGAGRGVDVDPEQLNAIKAEINNLREQYPDAETTGEDLSATWRLVFTTEQETLFILKNAKLFGTEAGDVFQVIDTEAETLQNVITFPPEGAFIVNSSIKVAGSQRVDFKFTQAVLQLPSRDFTLPPFGKGWFDNVYVDEDYRVAVDIRGSLLIVARDGPPRVFE